MKYVLLLGLIPFLSQAQTVHVKDGAIDYKGTVIVKGVSKTALLHRAKNAVIHCIDTVQQVQVTKNKNEDKLEAAGKMNLSPNAHTDNVLFYTVEIQARNGQYKYHIHKVRVAQYRAGQKIKDISSKDLLKGMESSGEGAIEAEKQLNEIDMDMQKLIALIKTDMDQDTSYNSRK